MQKVVITGGIGYIGTELCRLYSGETRFKNVVVVDNRFVSERVKELRDRGIDFIHGDIMDETLMAKVLWDADIVHHLAGITDVAYTKTESGSEKDKQIAEVGVMGTRNIIKYTPAHCKIIFPSTHVVYEGFDRAVFDITEEVEPTPMLTYSTGKVQSEKDLAASDKDFVVLRLGSNYGYSNDTTRINIMPNLFSKIASQNGTIKMFAGGVQYKSLVSVFDVARCLKFVAEQPLHREIYHCTNEIVTVKQVAEICKEFNPKLQLIATDDEIPNAGYTLSNKKLLSTGFKFRYNVRDSIKQMIKNWSATSKHPDMEYIEQGTKEFIDYRGKISNYELTEPINWIGYIESKAGVIRANHYHPVQEQKVLLITGEYISVHKDLSEPNAPLITQLAQPGDMIITKPNVAHTMVFTKDSILLNLVRGEREHENFGEHTITSVIVDEDLRQSLIANYKKECRSCANTKMKKVVSLGMSPLANNLLDNLNDKPEMFPLEMDYCPQCHNCQLSVVVPPQKMFDNYLYVSSTAKSFRDHFENAAVQFINDFKLNANSLVVDIGSNDGIFLKPLKERNVKILGVEPAKNVADIANGNGIETIQSYFTEQVVDSIIETKGKADLVTASNVFAHSDGVKAIAKDAFKLLKEDGTFIVEVQYLLDTIKDLTFDNIYHEHVNYWSVTSINNFFNRLNLSVVKVEHINTHGGSIRVYVQRQGYPIDNSVNQFLMKEKEFGLLNYETYQDFGKRIETMKKNTNNNLKNLKSKYAKIVGYGSPAKATTALNYYGVSTDILDYIVEDNSLKHNKVMPGVTIPIKSKDAIAADKPNAVVILAWNFAEDIIRNNQHLVDGGIEFINIKDLAWASEDDISRVDIGAKFTEVKTFS